MAEQFITPPLAPPLVGLPLGEARRVAKKRGAAAVPGRRATGEDARRAPKRSRAAATRSR